jgi:lipid A 3-O-deacylase
LKNVIAGLLGAACLALSVSGVSAAGSSGALYNMDAMLNQPHPFAQPYRAPAAPPRAMVQAPAAARAPAPAPKMAAAPLNTGGEEGWNGIVSELRGGVFAHDQGPFGSHKESGVDGNLEVLFVSPDFLDVIWAPRPHLGLTVNSGGDTSQAYLGLTWEWSFWDGFFFDFGFGGAVHNGELKEKDDVRDKKALGCRVLFRESIDIGYRFNKRHAVMAHLDHISNAKLCDKNEGLDNLGVRYGYMF